MSQLAAPFRSIFSAVMLAAVGASSVACAAKASSPADLERRQTEIAGRDLGSVRLWNEPGALEQAPYTVSVDNQALPILPAGHIVPAYYTRFQLNQPVVLEIRVPLKEGERLNLQPARYRQDLEAGEGAFKLAIHEPGPRVFMIESDEKDRHSPLILFPEASGVWAVPATAGELFDASRYAEKGVAAPVVDGSVSFVTSQDA